jgi:hypothetical protein
MRPVVIRMAINGYESSELLDGAHHMTAHRPRLRTTLARPQEDLQEIKIWPWATHDGAAMVIAGDAPVLGVHPLPGLNSR